jgi:carbonic anhydrase
MSLSGSHLGPKLSLKVHWIVLYKVDIIYVDQKSKMAATAGQILS